MGTVFADSQQSQKNEMTLTIIFQIVRVNRTVPADSIRLQRALLSTVKNIDPKESGCGKKTDQAIEAGGYGRFI